MCWYVSGYCILYSDKAIRAQGRARNLICTIWWFISALSWICAVYIALAVLLCPNLLSIIIWDIGCILWWHIWFDHHLISLEIIKFTTLGSTDWKCHVKQCCRHLVWWLQTQTRSRGEGNTQMAYLLCILRTIHIK